MFQTQRQRILPFLLHQHFGIFEVQLRLILLVFRIKIYDGLTSEGGYEVGGRVMHLELVHLPQVIV